MILPHDSVVAMETELLGLFRGVVNQLGDVARVPQVVWTHLEVILVHRPNLDQDPVQLCSLLVKHNY